MSTTATYPATPPPLVDIDATGLVREIELYLAARTRTTSHPLVTKTTTALIAEALGTEAPAAAPALELPGRMLRILPDWVLCFPIVRHRHGGARQITVAEHLELTALVIERYGWAQGTHRTTSGRRCILGAQAVLYRLGLGDESTVAAAAQRLQTVLRARGCTLTYAAWNDLPDRSQGEVIALVRTAALAADR
ncbi:hypothetical protein OIC43_31025 [Streptomyces sp. NBC_00825]|uniref:DUF6197 family protein n=1 Tax=unclassified Streptomyces TaxID=2593676 RepID=UPI002ED260A5|nr:hypothetical protein OG832_12660 [Streptomyces sp. NBC_00826]WTH93148.1 hypothetical protein OIC43_31025 [Streptomyces sp. NBC_00825]WTI01880.1 hypothetical protein OHA23_31005 [Streptomyces sp. NBC_00822]